MDTFIPNERGRARTTSSFHQQTLRTSNTNPTTMRHSFQSESNVGHQHDSTPVVRLNFEGETMKLRPIAEMSQRPNWVAGAEPGLDPTKENGGRAYIPTQNTPCIITAVDFDKDHVSVRDLDNTSLPDFLKEPRLDHSVCRWINCNGLSWDVIQALGVEYKLSHLALEDLCHTKSRTKADWYKNHMFIILSLTKLMSQDVQESDDESEGSSGTIKAQSLLQKLSKVLSVGKSSQSLPTFEEKGIAKTKLGATSTRSLSAVPYRTLQRYHGGENEERVDYMESQSLLKEEDLEVCVEQVSIFVTSSNEIISFFETSAKEIEVPLMRRLSSSSTMVRQTADATMVAQGIIDAIIDLAFPVNMAFKNAIDQMEIDVLTQKPDKKYANLLYILKSEMTAMKNLMSPITKMIQTLRNHRTLNYEKMPSTIVKISEMTHTYLGDVEDHCLQIEESLNQMIHSAGEISDLIFNTLNIDTNNVMKTLTIFTVLLLPLTFLTGYFGMNFTNFGALGQPISFFWKIAIPVMVVVGVLVEYRGIRSFFTRKKQRRTFNKKRETRERRLQSESR